MHVDTRLTVIALLENISRCHKLVFVFVWELITTPCVWAKKGTIWAMNDIRGNWCYWIWINLFQGTRSQEIPGKYPTLVPSQNVKCQLCDFQRIQLKLFRMWKLFQQDRQRGTSFLQLYKSWSVRCVPLPSSILSRPHTHWHENEMCVPKSIFRTKQI